MIRNLSIEGFKSFKKVDFSLKPLTLLCGFNNSGKSSIIQAIRMFVNSADGLSPLLPGHGSVGELRSKYVSTDVPIKFEITFEGGAEYKFELSESSHIRPSLAPLMTYLSADRWGPRISLPLSHQLSGFPQIGDRGEFVLGFLHDLRTVVIPDALHHPSSEGSTLEYEIVGWLSEIAPGVSLSYDTSPKQDSAAIEFDSFRPTNVGFGLSYCLPILAAILGAVARPPAQGWESSWGNDWEKIRQSRGRIVMIENPEAHLHPSGQTALGRMIALGASCGVQFIIESQSDHLMDGIRLAVKDEILKPEQVIFHYLSRDAEGQSKHATPQLQANGKLDSWPEGFFDQTLKNRSRLAR